MADQQQEPYITLPVALVEGLAKIRIPGEAEKCLM